MPRVSGSEIFRRAALLAVFTLSGASGLIYEVLWARRLTRTFGSTTPAVSTVLAAFMGGLAAGSVLLGAWADRNRGRTLRAYGLLELAIGAFGLAFPLLLEAVEALSLAAAPEDARTAFWMVRFALVGAVLLLPCALMGGTLPVLARWLVGREEEIGGRVGALYAANTLGAFAGTAAATYVLLPRAGVREGELVAIGLNLVAGLVALAMAAGEGGRASRIPPPPAETEAAARPCRAGMILWATSLSGFACMVDEVAWARLVGMVFDGSVHPFGLMLLLFLGGMSIGGAIFARLSRADPARTLAVALAANTGAALLGIAAVPRVAAFSAAALAVPDSFARSQAIPLLGMASLMLPLAIFFGIAFPAAVAAVSDAPGMGRGVGRVTLWNTAGTVAGAFLGGFVLIPRMGLRATLAAGAAATAVGGLLAFQRGRRAPWMRTGLIVAGFALTAAVPAT